MCIHYTICYANCREPLRGFAFRRQGARPLTPKNSATVANERIWCAYQERDRERNNQRFAELWRKIGEVKDKLFNTARANHEIERNLGVASRNAATAKHNLDVINQSLEQNRKAEQRKSRGWSMSR